MTPIEFHIFSEFVADLTRHRRRPLFAYKSGLAVTIYQYADAGNAHAVPIDAMPMATSLDGAKEQVYRLVGAVGAGAKGEGS